MPHRARLVLELSLHRFWQADFAGLLTVFALPLGVQLGERMDVFRDPQDLALAFHSYRLRLAAHGVTGLSGRVTAVELPRGGRFRVWFAVDHIRATGRDREADRMILYCRQHPEGLRVELMHLTQLGVAPETRARLVLA